MFKEEKREYKRIPVYFKIASLSVLEPSENCGYIRDISEGGMKIDAITRIESGITILLNFSLPVDDFEFKDVGAIVKWIAKGRMGIEFIDLSERQRQVIEVYATEYGHLK
ncbi:MAG: PilZ domain-containing protein [Candidatus Firestonebacteria bacterium]